MGTPQTVNNEAGKDIEININKTDTINISGVEKQVSPTPDTNSIFKGENSL